jgi:hypothetical protein
MVITYKSVSAILVSPPNPEPVAVVSIDYFSGILSAIYRNRSSNCVTRPSRGTTVDL